MPWVKGTDLFPSLGGARLYRALFWSYITCALLAFAFLMPPFQKNDEPSHYYRAVSLANGDLFCTKDAAGNYYTVIERRYDELPDAVDAFSIASGRTRGFSFSTLGDDFSDPKWREPVRAYEICNLAPPGYLPNVLGVLAGKPFQSPIYGFYLGRAFGALFFAACFLLALRIVPARHAVLLYFYAALPMVLHQVTSFSYDAVQLSLFPLLFAYLSRFLTEDGVIRRRDLAAFMGLLLWTVLIKSFAFYGLLLLYFVIPRHKVAPGLRQYLGVTAGFGVLTALTVGLFETVYLERSGLIGPQEGAVDPGEQLRFALEHPLHFVEATYRTLQAHGEALIRQAAGVFGWVGFEVNAFVIYLVVVAAGLLCYYLAEHDRVVLPLRQLGALWAAMLVTTGSLFFAMYAVWSPVGADTISGLQGRYFIGLTPFAMLAVSQTAAMAGTGRAWKLLTAGAAVFILISSIVAIQHRYYS